MPTIVTFRGHPDPVKRGEGTPGQIEYCGIVLPLNQPVEIAPGALTAQQKAKLLTNHNFIVEESEAAAAPAPVEEAPTPKSPAKSSAKAPAASSPIPSSQDAAPAKLPQTPPAAAVEASAATSSPAAATAPVTMAKPVRPVGLTKAK